MNRRLFLQSSAAFPWATNVLASLKYQQWGSAAEVLEKAVATGPMASAVLHVRKRETTFTKRFGKALSDDASFLLGSITKPMCITALMTLFDKKEFSLDDRVKKFLPKFTSDGREDVTLRHLLTHVSGLPDQLPNNAELRGKHAGLAEFVEYAQRVPLSFKPRSRYQYSSMAILLASHLAELISGVEIKTFVDRVVFQPLGMKHSALGLGRFALAGVMPCQTEFGAPEAGAGDPAAKSWDWNSLYWRNLGAPWGGGHSSAADVGRFLAEFFFQRGDAVKPETARLMTTNHNPPGFTPRGLGLAVGPTAGSAGCSDRTFGHTGSTGTLAWADPATETICVVLSTLPARAVQPHPRDLAAAQVSRAMR